MIDCASISQINLSHRSLFVNPSLSYHSTTHYDNIPQSRTDYLCASFGAWGARSYAPNPPSTIKIEHPYISFSGHPFSTKVPLWFNVCSGEAQWNEVREVHEEMQDVKGNVVELDITQGEAPHDIILVGDKVGFEIEAEEAAARAGRWLSEVAW